MRRAPLAFVIVLASAAGLFAADTARTPSPASTVTAILLALDPVTLDRAGWETRLHDASARARSFAGPAAPQLEAGRARASQVLALLTASACCPRGGDVSGAPSPNISLDVYAKNAGGEPDQFENFEAASRRILAGGTTTKRTPDAVARELEAAADAILASVRAAETAAHPRGREFDAAVTDLKIVAQLARFHALRSIAAVHYNLFKRGLRLAELLAATYKSRDVVAAWRELTALAGDRYPPALTARWRDTLVRLEADLKALEDQCCPPDEAIVKEKVWTPASSSNP